MTIIVSSFQFNCIFLPDQINNKCASRSTGSVSCKLNGMFQQLKSHECELSSPSLWPEDYGPTVFNKGNKFV